MKRLAFLLGILLLALFLWRCNPPQIGDATESSTLTIRNTAEAANSKAVMVAKPNQPAGQGNAGEAPARAIVAAAYNTPIAFWGKAVDETGQPVAGATVQYVASDKFFGDGSDYNATSDPNGLFSLSGVKGLSLSVNVRKAGYYRIEHQSHKLVAFGYTTPSKEVFPAPTEDKPTIFVLRKMKLNAELIRSRGWQLVIPQDGKPVEVRMEGMNNVAAKGAGHFIVETNLDLTKLNQGNKYPWRCRITVPGGGLIERANKLDFEAPTEGYKSQDLIEMSLPRTTNEFWAPRAERDYFLKLPGGKYGRLHIDIHISDLVKKNSIYFEGAMDPNGSRNLEIGADENGNPL
jgi:hypothetical protein